MGPAISPSASRNFLKLDLHSGILRGDASPKITIDIDGVNRDKARTGHTQAMQSLQQNQATRGTRDFLPDDVRRREDAGVVEQFRPQADDEGVGSMPAPRQDLDRPLRRPGRGRAR